MHRSILTLAVLLMAIFPTVMQANENAPLLQITSPTANMTSVATPDCKANLLSTEEPAAGLAVFAPELRQSIQYCGACSQNPCQGAERYSMCGYDWSTQTAKRCDYYLGGTCSEDGLMNCRCYSEAIP